MMIGLSFCRTRVTVEDEIYARGEWELRGSTAACVDKAETHELRGCDR